jgi:hypothetical protein
MGEKAFFDRLKIPLTTECLFAQRRPRFGARNIQKPFFRLKIAFFSYIFAECLHFDSGTLQW